MVSSSGSQESTLKAPLKDVLACLDIDLDAELTRFRRSRTGKSAPPPRRFGSSSRFKSRQGLDLIAVKPVGSAAPNANQPTSGLDASGLQSPPQTLSKLNENVVENHAGNHASTPETAHYGYSNAGLMDSGDLWLDESSPDPSLRDLAALKAQLTGPSSEPQQETEPDLVAAGELALVQAASESPGQMEVGRHIPAQDYLESSEALLNSARPAPKPRPDASAAAETSSFQASLLTPLGIGSMLLLLFTSTALSYVLVNPETLSHLWGKSSESTAENGTPELTASGDLGASQSPNLAAQEFVELDLNTLSTLDNSTAKREPAGPPAPNSSQTPGQSAGAKSTNTAQTENPKSAPQANQQVASATPSTAPVPTGIPTKVVTAPVRPEARPNPVPAPAPAPQAALPQVPASAPAATPPAGDTYYVISDYTGDAALDEARTAVGDAFVRNFSEGARIQMGAFQDKARAQELIQDLENQGIPARIQSPE